METITFSNPTGSLTVNAGDGDDIITLMPLDEGFTAPVTVDGGPGDNKVVVEGVLTTPVVWENASGTGITAGTLLITGTVGKDIVDVKLIGLNGSDGHSEGGSDGGPDTHQIKVTSRLDVRGSDAHSDGGSDGSADINLFDPTDVERIRIVLNDGDDKATIGSGSDGGSDSGADLSIPAIIEGDGGNDHLKGGAGNDSIFGGPGKDKLDGRDGDDHLDGGDDDDDLKGGKGNDVLVGGAGDDKLDGGKGQDLLIGGLGADDIKAGSDGGSDGGADVLGDILISGLTIFDNDGATLRDILDNDWIARFENGDDYDGIASDLVANHFIPGVTVFDDQAKDKLKGSRARDLFFADIDGEDDDDDKVKAKKDELIVDLAELLTL
ncbi:MAG: calcium-binding protein [Pirellulales bacterium]